MRLGSAIWLNHTRIMNDTTPEAREAQLAVLRAMSPARKLALAAGWTSSLREMIRAEIRRLHPDLDEPGLAMRFAERWLGTETAHKAYPHHRHG